MAVDNAREICTQIFNDWREAEHYGHVELMMMAFRRGHAKGRIEAFEETLKTIRAPRPTTVMDEAEEMMDAIREWDRSAIVSNSNGHVVRRGER